MYLEKINSPADIKKLNYKEIEVLCKEIRVFLLENISKTGGHLASNLGVVELTAALHYVFELPRDKIIFDVGHQSYVHKILTGRRDKFHTLRQLGGISGFPKTSESEYDTFNTGHSSTSISAALGMCKARDLSGGDFNVIAVIGDGSLTGGEAFEGLDNASSLKTKLIIVINDNNMSISQNVGGLAEYLNSLTSRELYYNLKSKLDTFLHKIPVIGKSLFNILRTVKNKIKFVFFPGKFFTDLGLTYFGPVDGHDFKKMKLMLERAKKSNETVVLHVYTTKGKGYKYAELNPDNFHGLSTFDVESGECSKSSPDYSAVFGEHLCCLAAKNEKICAITAAMPCGTGLVDFSKNYPERFFDVGIAEQHAVTFAAGLALGGCIPVVAVYSTFLQRAYDQVLHDAALSNLHVVFAIDRAGLVGEDGETHQGMFDLAYLSSIPNMTVMAPSDYRELKKMLDFAVKYSGVIAIRYPRGRQLREFTDNNPIEYGKSRILFEGNDVTLLALGKMVSIAADVREILQKSGVSARVVDLRFAKPLDTNAVEESAQKSKLIVSMEDASIAGGISCKIKETLNGKPVKFLAKTFPDEFIPHGSVGELFKKYKMDAEAIAEEILKNL